MRIFYSLGIALFIAACTASSTPLGGTCATRVSGELSALQAAIQTAETNLARGYSEQRRAVAGGTQIEVVRISINAAKERRILADLKARLGPVQAQTDIAVAQCAGA